MYIWPSCFCDKSELLGNNKPPNCVSDHVFQHSWFSSHVTTVKFAYQKYRQNESKWRPPCVFLRSTGFCLEAAVFFILSHASTCFLAPQEYSLVIFALQSLSLCSPCKTLNVDVYFSWIDTTSIVFCSVIFSCICVSSRMRQTGHWSMSHSIFLNA